MSALYFTKGPGDKYMKVYAQYNGDPAWIPLHITVPAVPDLQQVRDMDRNIALDSGSYEDAHFYLRSADGNNMTAAFYTNAEGGAIQAGNVDDYANLNLQPDGGTLTYGGAEVATQDWARQYALTWKNDTVTDFNSMTQAGIYKITANLTTIPNYPHIGNNNNGATAGYLVVHPYSGGVRQFFYPTNELGTVNRGTGYWCRMALANPWEYKNNILSISMNNSPVSADNLTLEGTYLVGGLLANINAGGYPDSGASYGGIPLMVTVKKSWGNVSFNYATTQEVVSVQESPINRTRKWIRSLFNWNGTRVWDAWNEVGLLRDVYTKAQLNTSGAGGAVHWDNVNGKPAIVNVETDPTVPDHVKAISPGDISNWNAKENAANKSTATALGSSDTFFPTQNAVKVYVDNAITTNNASYVPLSQKGIANGVATLGSNGKIPDNQMPAIAITNTNSVASQAEMLALTAETGDVAVRTDLNKSFILQASPASTLANWIELRSPTVTNSDQVPEGTANLYFTNARSRNALSAVAPVTYNSASGAIGIGQAGASANGYLSSSDWNTFNSKEPAFGKNAAFNKNFGTAAGTVAEGNDSRINNGQTAYGWGNHAAQGYLNAVPGIGSVLNTYNLLAQAHSSSIMFNSSFEAPIGGNANMILFKVENGFTSGTTNGGIYWTKVHGGGGEQGTWNTSSYNGGHETASIEGVTDSSGDTGIGMGLQFKVQDFYWHGYGMNNAYVAMKLRARGAVVFPAYGDGTNTKLLTAGPDGTMGVAATGDWIKSAPGAAQTANPWISGLYKGDGFVVQDGSKIIPSPGYWGLYTSTNAAQPLKTGGLTISDSYSDNAPAYGLSVKGDSWLRGNTTINGNLTISPMAGPSIRMVVADISGTLSTQALPADNWFGYNGYPDNYVTPSLAPSGAVGLATGGGFSASGVSVSGSTYAVKNEDYTMLFQNDCTVTLPDPVDWPGRILKLRSGPYTVYLSGYNVISYGAALTSFSKGIEIQSIDGAWHLIIASV